MPRPLRVSPVPHYLALVRAGLGLTQAQLAGVLGVSRQFITRVEAGERPLPAGAGEALAWLARGLPSAPTPDSAGPEAEPPAPDPAEAALLPARAEALAYEVGQLSRRLARGQARARRAHDWLRAVPVLEAALPAGAERSRLWLAATTADAEAALEGAGRPTLHRLLAARLVGLRAEAEALAAELGVGPP